MLRQQRGGCCGFFLSRASNLFLANLFRFFSPIKVVLVLERPHTIIVMAVNYAKTGHWDDIIDSNYLRKDVGNDGFSSSPSSSSSSSSASKTASSSSSSSAAAAAAAAAAIPAKASAAAAKAASVAAAAVSTKASAAAAAVSTKASAGDNVFQRLIDSHRDNEKKSAASSKTGSSLP